MKKDEFIKTILNKNCQDLTVETLENEYKIEVTQNGHMCNDLFKNIEFSNLEEFAIKVYTVIVYGNKEEVYNVY